MFCVKCGKEISEGTRFCPHCGNQVVSEGKAPAAPEEKSGNAKKIIIMLCAIVVVLAVVVVLLMNNRGSNSDTSQVDTSSVKEDSQTSQNETEEHTPNFDFAVEGYVEIQEGKVDTINVKEYLPDKDMITIDKTTVGDKTITIPSSITLKDGEGGHFAMYTMLDDNSSWLVKYNDEKDCLQQYTSDINGQVVASPYLLQVGKIYHVTDEIDRYDVEYLFTVNTEAGTFEDCVAVVQENTSDYSETKVTYYAKGIGEILSVSAIDKRTFEVSVVLSGIDYGNKSSEEKTSDTPQPDTNTPFVDTPFYDGWIENNPRFECFETAGGEDVIVSFYEENGQIMLKIGKENPLPINYDDDIEGYEGYADDGSHIIIQAVSGNEIEIMGYKDYYGTYIGLPDADATEG